MGEKQYLYGAAVQGIQGYIYQTNELKDIVGASELVELICTDFFAEQLGESRVDFLGKDKNRIISAAGNIKYIFDDIKTCEKIVKEFPKYVLEHAPGVTISQAVVEYEKSDFKGTVEKLEQKLRSQRNKPMRSMTMGLMGIRRSRTTGLPLTHEAKGDFMDESTYAKRYDFDGGDKRTTLTLCRKAFYDDIKGNEVAYNIEDITTNNDWIAIIHADGNGLGQVVQAVGGKLDKYKEFSRNLDAATKAAARAAFCYISEKYKFRPGKVVPIRPIVLGGDDFTAICRGDFAIDYTREFLKQFEHFTQEKLGEMIKEEKVFGKDSVADKLTACAGVAFIKSSYPFYYGYNLAEALCDRAKKDAKNVDNKIDGQAQSCLMFHKVQDSFVVQFDAIAERELTPQEGLSFEFGPYYLDKLPANRWTIDGLINETRHLDGKEGNAIKSHLRRWMTVLHDNGKDAALQIETRLKSITPNKDNIAFIDRLLSETRRDKVGSYPVYDVLSLFSVIYQTTKEEEKKK